MSAPAAGRLIRQSMRHAARNLVRPSASRRIQAQRLRTTVQSTTLSSSRCISYTATARAGLMPDTAEPKPPAAAAADDHVVLQATELTDEEYHALADEYIDAVTEKASEIQETREDVEVEYAAGVLNIVFPPNGTYVVNKQPPNKQIWLSSPISGPKRYDWVVEGESMHQKEGGGQGKWVYLRDGTELSALLSKELGMTIDHHHEDMEASKDPTE